MNSLIISVVDIDGSGNGQGLIKMPMMNNIKLGLTLTGIKVAKGGCIVAGSAELSGVSASILNEQQRANLQKAYAAYNQVIENTGAIIETYDNFSQMVNGVQKKAAALVAKIGNGGKPTKAEVEALKSLTAQTTANMQASLDVIKKQMGEQVNAEAAAKLQAMIDQNKANAAALTAPASGQPTPAALAAAASSLAATQPAQVEKQIKELPPLAVEYNGKTHGHQKTISITTSSNQLKIKNLIDGEAFTWKLSDGTTGAANPVTITFPAGKTELTLEVSQENRKMSVVVKKNAQAKLEGLTLVDYDTPSRVATDGQTLYLIPTPGYPDMPFGKGVAFNRVISTIKTNLKAPKPDNFESSEPIWSIVHDGKTDPNWPNKNGQITFQIPLNGSTYSHYVYTAKVGTVEKSVKVEMVEADGEKQKGQINLENFGKDVKKLTEITKTTDEQLAKLEKIGLFRRIKDKLVFESEDKKASNKINVFFNVVPIEVTYENKEKANSPLYYRERKFSSGFEAGIKSEFKYLLVGLPIKEGAKKIGAPDYVIDWIDRNVKAEVNAKIKADTKAEVKVVQVSQKIVGSNEYIDLPAKVDPAAINLSIDVGVEAEISINKDGKPKDSKSPNISMLSVGVFASGMAKAEIFTLGYANSRWDYFFFRKGIYVEVTAGAYVTFLGYKHELDPYYQKIVLMEPPKQEK